MKVPVQGRRLPDARFGDLPSVEIKPGDYWRYLDRNDSSKFMENDDPGNLTKSVWGYMSPDGNGIGTLMIHTVREHEDGTISIIAGDGTSNSVLHRGARPEIWHGYVDHGVWNSLD